MCREEYLMREREQRTPRIGSILIKMTFFSSEELINKPDDIEMKEKRFVHSYQNNRNQIRVFR